MSNVHQLPTDAGAHSRLLEQLVAELIGQHPDPQVAERWATMTKETLSRYPGPPKPTQSVLDLDQIEGLSSEQKTQLHALTQSWLLGYFNDVRGQLMNVHRDFMLLQKRVAELETNTTEP